MATSPITQFKPALAHVGPRFLGPSIISATGSAFLTPILPAYLTQTDASLTFVSAVLAAASIGAVAGTIPASIIIRHIGEQYATLGGIALAAIGTMLLAFGGGAPLAFVACLAAGFGQSIRLLSTQSYNRRAIGARVRGRIMSLFGGGMRAGALVGPLVAGFLAKWYGFGTTFLIAGGLMAAGCIPLLISIHRTDVPVVPLAPPEQSTESLLQVIRAHFVIISLAGLAQMGTAAVRFGRLALIPLYGLAIGLETDQLGLTIAIASATDLVLFPVAGWLMDAFGRLFAIVPAFLLMSAGLLALPLADSFWTLTGVGVIIGIGNGIGSGTMLTISTDLAPADNPARFLAALRLLGDTGRILGTVLVGFVADRLDLAASAYVLAAIGVASAALFAFGIGETRTLEHENAGTQT